ncbi:FRAS1-related extracellular matrix protein 2 [Chanos chanos]|uniref:FRAS1-related extracellular matrix protein 2 n=1 Tax=Chanos chanos TaxID=29144 RepID=A0A6J2VD74_CHACN|nr:FRAS1-related extracellular matrix protein 2-like [Chanos chanos]
MLSKDLAKHKPGDTHGDSRHRAGVVILIFIIIGIMMLIGTLYFLRKKGRSYSFDLAHPSDHETPLRSMEQEGTFEQTNKETPVSLDYEQEDKVNHTDNSVVNGVAAELSEKTPDDKIDSSSEEQNVAEENSFSSESSLTTPIKKVEFNLDLDLGSDKSSVTTPTTTESQDGQHNENNNNVTLIATTAAGPLGICSSSVDATFHDSVLQYQQRQRPDIESIVLAKQEVTVPHGSSVFLDPYTHLSIRVLPEDRCRITVLDHELLTQRFGMLTPKKFSCTFTKGEVKYTHFGSQTNGRDQVRLQLRYDSQTNTIIIPLTVNVHVTSNIHAMVKLNQPLVVHKENGYSNSIDGQGLTLTFGGKHSNCLLKPLVGIGGLPRYGSLVNYISNGQSINCNAFFSLGVRYKLNLPESLPRVDFIPMLVEQLDVHGRKLRQEHFQIKVIINGAGENSPPRPSFIALMMMEVSQFVLTAITSDMLAAEDLESDPEDLIFNVLSPPEQGFIISTDDQNQPINSFCQKALKDLKIAYKPPADDSESERIFHAEFEVVDVEGSSSDRFSFMIVVKPMNTLAPVVTLNSGQILFEGQSRPISSTLNLRISDEDNLADVKISVVRGLHHGILTVLGSQRKFFTPDDLAAGVVMYEHDGSETCNDNLVFRMTDGTSQIEFLFPVTIVPLDNKPPVVNVNTGLVLVKGEIRQITPMILSATDMDSEDRSLKFSLVSPYSSVGQLLFRQAETPADPSLWIISEVDHMFERVVTTWYLSDIMEGKLFYRYVGPHFTTAITDQFVFLVQDDSEPPNYSKEQTFIIKIHPLDDLPPKLHPGTTLQISVKECELTVIRKDTLRFKDLNSVDKDLHYTIIFPPANGNIVLTDSPNTILKEFTQAQINHGKVAYKPPSEELGILPKVVQFAFRVRDAAGNSADGLFTILLQPVNNKAPQIANRGFSVMRNSSYIITKTLLDVTDQDTADDNIVFTVKQVPDHGLLKCGRVNLLVGKTFSLKDIENGLLMYIHNGVGGSLHDTIKLEISDGRHHVPFAIRISISPASAVTPAVTLPPSLLDIVIEVKENGETKIISNRTKDRGLQTEDVRLVLTVDSPPRFGVIQVNGVLSRTFTLYDLNSGAVSYVHTAGEVGQIRKDDFFNLTVSGKWIIQGNVIQKVRVHVPVLPVDNIQPVIHIVQQFTVIEGSENIISSDFIQAQDMDSEVDNILCNVLAQPSFGYLENVSPSPGSEKSRSGVAITGFSIKDIRLRHIQYVQSVHEGTEPVEDRLTFQCTDGTNLSEMLIFPIVIIPANEEKPSLFIREFVVMEGMSLTFDIPILNAVDTDVPKDSLEFEIVNTPKHGKIVQHSITGTVPVVKFSLEQIETGSRIVYEHDGSETRNDTFTIRLTDGRHMVEKQVIILILPVDDETPRLAINSGLEVKIGETATITNRLLKATDLDSEDKNLTFVIRQGPVHGLIQHLSRTKDFVLNLTVGMRFTQDEIDKGLIQYTHTGQGGVRDLVKFDVTDGINPLIDRYFYITVGAVDTVFPVVINKGVTLTEGGRVTLTTDLLSSSDLNSPDEHLHYTITRPPTHGRLECTDLPGISVSTFTQLQLAGSKIRYIHTSLDEARMDSFEFQVTDGQNMVFRTFRVSITDIDNKRPVLSVHGLIVGQGKLRCITPFELSVEDQDTPDHKLHFIITHVPSHGRILYNGTRSVMNFTKEDLSENLITYKHDGTESEEDSIMFTVTDGTNSGFFVFPEMERETTQPQVLKIKITGDLYSAPRVVISRPALSLTLLPTGQWGFKFSSKVLKTKTKKQKQGKDVPSVDLIYRVTELPKYGFIRHTEKQSNSSIFTQADIDDMKICYILFDGVNASSDVFYFTVEDRGGNQLQPQSFWLKWAWVSLERQFYQVQEEVHTLEVTLQRRGYLGETSFVSISTKDGTAVHGQDFHGNIQRQVQFNPGQTRATWRLRIIDDQLYESSESFQIVLSEPVMTLIEQPSTATVEITDPQDECTVFFSQTEIRVEEDVGELLIPVQRSGDISLELMVICYTQQGSAKGTTPGSVLSFSDYITCPEDHSSILRFEPGDKEKTCRVIIIDDALYERAESFNVSLTSAMGGRVKEGHHTTSVIILPHHDDEPYIFLRQSEYEVEESAGFVELQVCRAGSDLSQPATVTITTRSTTPASAQAGVDYVAIGKNVDFASGEAMVTVRVLILDDMGGPVLEGPEQFELFLSMPTNASLGQPIRAIITIHDSQSDVPTVQFEFSEYSVREADGRAVAVVIRSGDLTQISEVRCYTRQSSAQVMMDYEERPDTDLSVITFQPGEREKTCEVTIVDDSEYEEEEEFRLVLGMPSSQSAVLFSLGKQRETLVKIKDEEDKPIIRFSETRFFVREPPGAGESVAVRIQVQRLGDCSKVSVVRVHTRDGSATAGEDYRPLSVELQFDQGQSLHFVEVLILHDTERETRETFTVHLKPDDNMVAEIQVTKAMVFIEESGSTGVVTFPAVPQVISILVYEDNEQTTSYNPPPPSGYPLVCVTACDRRHSEFSTLESVCVSEGLNDSLSEFRWFLGPPRGPDGSAGPMRELEAGVFFAPSHGRLLDGVYFRGGWRVQCAARAVSVSGQTGLELSSNIVDISTTEGMCQPHAPNVVGTEPFTAKIRYTGSDDHVYPNLISLTVTMPHVDGMLPLISTRPLSDWSLTLTADISRVGNHRCSNLLDGHEVTTNHGFVSHNPDLSSAHGSHYPLWSPSALRFYSNLDLEACLWTFRGYFGMSELLSECGGTVSTDRQVLNLVQSFVSLRLPLYVSYLFHAPSGWLNFDLQTELRLTFVYDTSILWQKGISSPQETELQGSLYPTSMRINGEGLLVVTFRTQTHFRGQFVLSHQGSSTLSVVRCVDQPALAFTLSLLSSESTYDQPTQTWIFTSQRSVRDYSGSYSVSLVPCVAPLTVAYTHTPVCNPKQPLTFSMDVRFQQVSDSVPVEFTLNTLFFLLSKRELWLSDGSMGFGEGADVVFSEGSQIFGRIMVDPVQNMGDSFVCYVEKVFLCVGADGYIPKYQPANREYGCLVDTPALIYRFKILDKASPETQTLMFGEVPFEARLAENTPGAGPLVRQAGSDGFSLSVAPLFQVAAGRQWYIHVIYTVRSRARDKKRHTRSLDPHNTHKNHGLNNNHVHHSIITHNTTKTANLDSVTLPPAVMSRGHRATADEDRNIGQDSDRGTNLQHISLQYPPSALRQPGKEASSMGTNRQEDGPSLGGESETKTAQMTLPLAMLVLITIISLSGVTLFILFSKYCRKHHAVRHKNSQPSHVYSSEGQCPHSARGRRGGNNGRYRDREDCGSSEV